MSDACRRPPICDVARPSIPAVGRSPRLIAPRPVSTSGGSRSVRSHSPMDHREIKRFSKDKGHYSRRDEHKEFMYDQKYTEAHGRKRTRHEQIARRTPVRSDWDDGKWECEDTPHCDSQDKHPMSRKKHGCSPSLLLVGASPDTRLVSPWLGGHTPRSTVGCASVAPSSPWDQIFPSLVPIRASGSSKRSSGSWYRGKSHQLSFSRAVVSEDIGTDKSSLSTEETYEITEELRQQMDYNADRA